MLLAQCSLPLLVLPIGFCACSAWREGGHAIAEISEEERPGHDGEGLREVGWDVRLGYCQCQD